LSTAIEQSQEKKTLVIDSKTFYEDNSPLSLPLASTEIISDMVVSMKWIHPRHQQSSN